ncbi:hypothetical protein C8J55DRAFT_490289 [Lentinula edodes]|uniref:Uncharacterized protein n=1 Tax=Lentinula lateritia TaxID=40482 RepID=A0A9W9DL71_9AGAR|nr:hypothetical protein C8J55DRAFT_490289 [Lentinula edodes]
MDSSNGLRCGTSFYAANEHRLCMALDLIHPRPRSHQENQGFAYAKPEITEERKTQFISVSKLILLNPLWSLVTDDMYLLPKLGIVNQNPDNVYKSREEQSPPYPEQLPPPYPEKRPPSHTERPILHVPPAQPANLQNPIVFFKQEAFPGTVAMRVPKTKIEEWGIKAMCYESENPLSYSLMVDSFRLNLI